ncbi:23S rRNA (adenine(2030)-N(6))-methyltransferase RlmJ [Rhodovarius crocodyli]|uniref:Ribosomal RNA large subunit methyltransferase J n=1 Tax=Rhodovarius crocodyli TaxID=1979269 RepID=A0A437MM92_9PROT|nr:23S rRNA (adenine(2030)-N(6))-methyltransferase RlmJ [Rhodovarius crocodyli]RVT98770.1 23S rRNA (adenine(2030)-N(6))-methyltransferase RlmJ [Rhodovarius crocodyli]
MNYRHAFHAGNFADCMKHALLVWLLQMLTRKPTPIRVLDVHAGIGSYDLSGPEAVRTGEWHEGIARLLNIETGPLVDYLDVVRPRLYPGSPAIAQAMLRPIDTLVLNELHPEDNATLKRGFKGVAVHQRDAYEVARALTPFPERRGLVLFDPPFEQGGEFDRLAEGMAGVWQRARGHVQAAWYPIKNRAPVILFHQALRDAGIRDIVTAELWLRDPTDATRLNGCGLAVVNPPWGFEAEGGAILAALSERLSDEAGAGWRMLRVCDE